MSGEPLAPPRGVVPREEAGEGREREKAVHRAGLNREKLADPRQVSACLII